MVLKYLFKGKQKVNIDEHILYHKSCKHFMKFFHFPLFFPQKLTILGNQNHQYFF
jgi:hypothetical protein